MDIFFIKCVHYATIRRPLLAMCEAPDVISTLSKIWKF